MAAPRIFSRCLVNAQTISAGPLQQRFKLGGGMWAGDEVLMVHAITLHLVPGAPELVTYGLISMAPPEQGGGTFATINQPIVLATNPIASVAGQTYHLTAFLPGTPIPWPYDWWLNMEWLKSAGAQNLRYYFSILGIIRPRGDFQAT